MNARQAWSMFVGVTAVILLCSSVTAEERSLGTSEFVVVGGRGQQVELYSMSHALVIGVSDYVAGWPDLEGVKKDVEAVKGELKRHGFDVTVVMDPSSEQMRDAFTSFINTKGMAPESRLLFYFAGHGYTMTQSYGDEMGYIVPSDAPSPLEDRNAFLRLALDMQQIEVYAKRIQAKHAIFVFDSCFSGSIFSLSRDLPPEISHKTSLPVRQFITSGSAEETVPHVSIFREQFVTALKGDGDLNEDGYLTGGELGSFLVSKVINYSRDSQHPQYGKIRNPALDRGDFVFRMLNTSQEPWPVEGDVEPPPTTTNSGALPPGAEREFAGLKFVWIPPGRFQMGSPKEEEDRLGEEGQHRVVLTKGFWLSKYEITQGRWREVMGTSGVGLRRAPELPMNGVNWRECDTFLKKINELEEERLRFPTEAEWEYACRAGSTGAWYFDATDPWKGANFLPKKKINRMRRKTVKVGSFGANVWGVHDMHGNVAEWCQDWYEKYKTGVAVTDPSGPESGSEKIVRGGGYSSEPGRGRAAFRERLKPGDYPPYAGFRPARGE